MGQVVVRYPIFDLKFYTETDQYHITYDSRNAFSNKYVADSVISLTTKNAFSDDSAVFSLVLSGDNYWDRILQANDAVVLKIDTNEGGKYPDNPVLLVGLISEVSLEGDYGENSKMYRITGQSFAKAFINFNIGVIQEVSVVLTDIGWLPDSTADGGFEMTQKTAAQMVESTIKHFIPFMKYNFQGKKALDKFLTWSCDSWSEAERLADVSPFINYEGTLKQMLDSETAKPFNELFFDATKDEKCQLTLRRTPFDQNDWNALPMYYATSKDVISEHVSISDSEAATIFNLTQRTNVLGASDVDLGAWPQYFPQLINKFGYKELQVENQYLDTAVADKDANETITADDDSNKEEENTRKATGGTFEKCYKLTTGYLEAYPKKTLRVKKAAVSKQIQGISKKLTKSTSEAIIDYYLKNSKWDEETFSRLSGIPTSEAEGQADKPKASYTDVLNILNINKTSNVSQIKEKLLEKFDLNDNQANSIASEFKAGKLDKNRFEKIMTERSDKGTQVIGTSSEFLKIFKKRLANWYCENPNFYSGDITVKGSPDYRLGGRLFVQDEQNNELWEYYIESVQHTYSYTKGYTTKLGVTRGLQDGGAKRFTNLWGKSQDFKGGLIGEKSLKDLLELQAKEDEKHKAEMAAAANSGGSGDDGDDEGNDSSIPGSSIAVKAANYGIARSKEKSNHKSYYLWGGGRGSDPFAKSEPWGMDCSSFVWWAYKHAGHSLAGGKGGMTTWTIKADSNLKTISAQGHKSKGLISKMKVGDIILFYPSNGHIGIYIGNGKWVGCNGNPEVDRSSTAGIHISSLSGFWYDQWNGTVLRLP